MAQLRQDYPEFVKRQTQVVVLGQEDAKAFEAYWHANDLPFIGLPDPKVSVLKLYGQEVNLSKLGRMPAQGSSTKPARRALSITAMRCPTSRRTARSWLCWTN